MLKSKAIRFFLIGGLTVLASVPAVFVADVINERAGYSRQTTAELGREWGGPQTLRGPVMMIPVEETVTVEVRKPVLDPDTGIQLTDENGTRLVRVTEDTRIERRKPIYVLPERFSAELTTQTQTRYRGFFSVPVYTGEVAISAAFDLSDVPQMITGTQRILWDRAALHTRVTANKGLRGTAELRAGSQSFKMEPLQTENGPASGFSARLGDPRQLDAFTLTLGLFGANSLKVSPVGRASEVTLTSDWAHPSFTGAFLPNHSDISDEGFTATWDIPHLARTMPQLARFDPTAEQNMAASFGVAFYQPNDFYQKSYRAARYAVMFIGLTFLAIFLLDLRRETPTHPVQYVLIGAAQLTFFLLMVALAEQIGFAQAYAAAGGATIALVSAFAALAMRFGWQALKLGGVLMLLYAVLYLILQSADYALLAGSTLAFLTIAATMFATRNEDWSGGGKLLASLMHDPNPAPTKRNTA